MSDRPLNDRYVRTISQRLSLRKPQVDSLEILADVLGRTELIKGGDATAALEAIRHTYSNVEAFERDFPSLCFALATGVGKTRLMGAFISYLYLTGKSRHFFVLAPNKTIYEKLIADFSSESPKYVFKGITEFAANPPLIVTGDNYESGVGVRFEGGRSSDLFGSDVHINIFNVDKINKEDATALERAKRFAALPEEEQERFFAERAAAAKSAIPDRDLANPERRARNVAEQAENAPDRESEMRNRSVSLGREDVKAQAEQYLREHYRNEDGEMTCQICKGPLPFKLDDGSEFFETVSFVPGLKKHHHQNYLALCPNHSAMYRHANGCRDVIRDMVEKVTGNELEVILAQKDMTIYLSAVHVIDIKAVLAVEAKLP